MTDPRTVTTVLFDGFEPLDVFGPLELFGQLPDQFRLVLAGPDGAPVRSAHGTPVVTSNTSSLPEVVGNAAVLVNPENVFEIMRALHRVLLDQPVREKFKQRGYEQVKRFSWDASARQILGVYKEVAGVSDPHQYDKAM